jgi:hypothetical protein
LFLFLINKQLTENVIKNNENPNYLNLGEGSKVSPNINKNDVALTNSEISSNTESNQRGILNLINNLIIGENNKNQTTPPVQHFKLSLIPTSEWTDFYGTILIDNKGSEIGDELAALDSNKSIIGIFTIKTKGKYGFLHVYSDDTKTTNKDGAYPGEEISFVFYDKSQDKEYSLIEKTNFSSSTRTNLDFNM